MPGSIPSGWNATPPRSRRSRPGCRLQCCSRRNEEEVIRETIKRIWEADYPKERLEIVVICHEDDHGTIAEARSAIAEVWSPRVWIETFSTPPINKPRGLNLGLARSSNAVVTVFDAEDDVHPDIFRVVNTIMQEEETEVVQAGVQLMNLRDHWFAGHNCLEYYFWYKSRLRFHADVGMIPLGGNSVFVRRELLERVGGWDETCLAEDADLGLRLSALGEPIRAFYSAEHATREETPDSALGLIRQRTRWLQGFMHVIAKGDWLRLPRKRQRLLAAYTLISPLLQGVTIGLWPLAILLTISLDVPVAVALLSFLPLYALLFQLILTIVGMWMFCREYKLKFPRLAPLTLTLTFVPFQVLLSIGAARAVWRTIRGRHNWEKTAHHGAHRERPAIPPLTVQAPVRAPVTEPTAATPTGVGSAG